MYVAACNVCSVTGQERFAGSSMIVAPDGTVPARAGEEECLVYADMNVDAVRSMRKAIPVFEDRVPSLY